jgi:hypothetical protein
MSSERDDGVAAGLFPAEKPDLFLTLGGRWLTAGKYCEK